MIIAKAKAKEKLGEFICLAITKANAKTNLQIFICNHFCVDGIQAKQQEGGPKHPPKSHIANILGGQRLDVYHWGQNDYLPNFYSRRIILGNSMSLMYTKKKF